MTAGLALSAPCAHRLRPYVRVYKQGRILCVPYKTNHRTGKRERWNYGHTSRGGELVRNLVDNLSSTSSQTELRNEIYSATFPSLWTHVHMCICIYVYIFTTVVLSFLLKLKSTLALFTPARP